VRSYPYSRVLAGKVPRSAFAGRIVVLGPAASLLSGEVRTPTADEPMSTAEVQANVVRTALGGFPLRSTSLGWTLALVVLLAAVPAAAGLRTRGWWLAALALVVAATFAFAVQLAFEHGRVVAFTYPLLALGLATLGVLLLGRLVEAFGRSREALSRFVPDAVASRVVERSAGVPQPGGDLAVGTVMYTDLRGFTTFSEGLAACDVISLLNAYFAEMSKAVLGHGGTLVAYLGDGLMAVFGAPLPQKDHADRALAAAREMLELRLPNVNEALRAQGFERGFTMGIGLNTGQFVSGIVGSRERLEYTAIGDTINTASRIEGMTKGTPYALFLADSTRDALTWPVGDLVYVDEVPVRGRTHTIKLWSLGADYVQKGNWEAEIAEAPTVPA
jgi:adenylate cyclase